MADSAARDSTQSGTIAADPGHMKWDIPYIAREVRPDAIYLNGSMQTPVAVGAPEYELFEGLYWLRRDSTKVIRPGA